MTTKIIEVIIRKKSRKHQTNQRHRYSIIGKLFMFSCLLLFGCEEGTVYNQYRHVPDAGWTNKDTLSFDVNVDSIPAKYMLSIETRNRGDYPYNNMYLLVMNNAKDSTVFVSDTVRFILSKEINGHHKWLGAGISDLYQMSHTYKSITLPQRKGHIIFKIKHIMQDQFLTGISDIGLKLSTYEPHQYGEK
jgi:gliding motility-associated lipoprotein GldH